MGACLPCHEAEAALWRGSHHDLAMQEATPGTVLGDFGGTRFEGPGSIWTFFRRRAEYFVRADRPQDVPGEYRVVYAFGVSPLQQYLVEFPGGRYQVMPVSWDSRPAEAGGQRWFDVQGDERIDPDDPLHWTGPNLNWNSMCAECHSTGLWKGYDSTLDEYSTRWVEMDVSCEACHGPGSEHVAWAGRFEGGSKGIAPSAPEMDPRLDVRFDPHDPGAWIPDPETGTARPLPGPDLSGQVDACGRCHARRSAITTRYRHGAPLLDTHRPALLEEDLYFADGQMQDEVFVWGSFVQSAMYRAGVTCNDCHEVHSLGLRGEDNGVCLRCHVASVFETADHHFHADGDEGSLCVSCHMPARTYMGVDARRDHSFRVPDPAVSEAVGSPDPCTTCHSEMTGSVAAQVIEERAGGPTVRRTRHHAEAIAGGRNGDPQSLAGLYALLRDPTAPSITRATALTLLGGDPSPERATAIRGAVTDPDPIVRLGALQGIQRFPTRELLVLASPLLGDSIRAVRLAAVEAVGSLAGAPSSGGWVVPPPLRSVLAAGLEEYRDAQRASEERPEAQLNLAWLAMLEGAFGDAEEALETAIRLGPTFVPAYVNLSDLYLRTGRDREGEPLLRSALELAPQSADLSHALGLLLVRDGRAEEAMTLLREATELDPRSTRYAYVYAVALQSAGDAATARTVLEQALGRSPNDRDLLFGLAVHHRDAGRAEEALLYARSLAEAHPFDPSGPALISELGG
jgi:Tfp pilus assembly protein PilF